jgi:esterase/lipase
VVHLGFEEKLLLWFRNSGHCLTVDSEKEQVWQSAYEFIVQHKRR